VQREGDVSEERSITMIQFDAGTVMASVFVAVCLALCTALPGAHAVPIDDARGCRPDDYGPKPDLMVVEADMRWSAHLGEQNFGPNHCALEEGVIGGVGRRKLLLFDATTANVGERDLYLGPPRLDGNAFFEWSPCHGHFHYKGYAEYTLQNIKTKHKIKSQKVAFCLTDSAKCEPGSECYVPGAPIHGKYTCADQGLSRGYADVYPWTLDGQWFDVTDVPNGCYAMCVKANPKRVLCESDYDNNETCIEVCLNKNPRSARGCAKFKRRKKWLNYKKCRAQRKGGLFVVPKGRLEGKV